MRNFYIFLEILSQTMDFVAPMDSDLPCLVKASGILASESASDAAQNLAPIQPLPTTAEILPPHATATATTEEPMTQPSPLPMCGGPTTEFDCYKMSYSCSGKHSASNKPSKQRPPDHATNPGQWWSCTFFLNTHIMSRRCGIKC
jgi:hypothetical protein